MTNNIQTIRGATPKIDETAFIASTAVIIGDVEIGARSSIWYHCVVRGDINEIRIGDDTNIQDGAVIHVDSRNYGTYIGAGVTVGHMALIHACTLEDACMVGMNATVMDGAVVESGALVAASALVPPGKRVPAGQLWAGSPARFVRSISETDRQMMDHIRPGYRDLAAEYRTAGLDLRDLSRDLT